LEPPGRDTVPKVGGERRNPAVPGALSGCRGRGFIGGSAG
jgi:hypothetical protein